MQLKIQSAIKKYLSARPTRFHMPGHKGGKFIKTDAKYDVTELSFIGNEEAVSLAEKDVSKILSAKFCRFLSDGASAGIFASLYAVKNLGKKIIISRTSHKSVYNALKIFGIEPIIIGGLDDDGLPTLITEKEIKKNLGDDVIGAFLTYPDYYGRTFDIEAISNLLKGNDKLFLVDNAHGNHYKFLGLKYAGDYADIWVDGVHKTNYTFNQGAIVCTNNLSLISSLNEGVNIFSTTSPSYIILSSIEYGIKYAYYKGAKEYARIKETVYKIGEEIQNLGFKVVDSNDPFKLTIDFLESKYDVSHAQEFLEKNKIFAELIDDRRILFMFSTATKNAELKKLVKVLAKSKGVLKKIDVEKKSKHLIVKKAVDYLTAVNGEAEYTSINEAEGKITAENFGTFPPCYPVSVAGEIILKENLEFLEGNFVFGVTDGKIKTLKIEE